MLKKLIITLSIITVAGVVGLLVYSNNRTYYNDDFVTGNWAGNLYNGGLFCEYENKIYFSNDDDDGALYVMNNDLTNVKKLNDDKATYINLDDNYIYYVRANNTKENHTGSILMFFSNGVYRRNHYGKDLKMISHYPAAGLSLSGNYLYYQRYDVEQGLDFYYSNIDGSGEILITDDATFPADIHDNYLTYSGSLSEHNLNFMNLATLESTTLMKANSAYPITFGNFIYYLNLDDDYTIYRAAIDGSSSEKVVDARCSTYNITLDGLYLYYQIDDAKKNGIHRVNLSTMVDEEILDGNFKQIHVTDHYVFFKEFNNEKVYMLASNGTGSLETFTAPVQKK